MEGEAPAMNKIIIIVAAVILVAAGVYVFYSGDLFAKRVFYTTPEGVALPYNLPAEGEARLREKQIRLVESDGSIKQVISPASVTLHGRVMQNPTTDPDTGEISFRATFAAGGRAVEVDVILGMGDARVSTLLTQSGFLDQEQGQLNGMTVDEAIALISSGEPIIVTFLLQDEVPQDVVNNPQCDEVCHNRVVREVGLYDDTKLLADSVVAGAGVDRTLEVGPVSQLVLYE